MIYRYSGYGIKERWGLQVQPNYSRILNRVCENTGGYLSLYKGVGILSDGRKNPPNITNV